MLKSYRVLHLYAQMVRDTNPSSIFFMQLERPKINITPTFKGFFILFDAMKKGFVNDCKLVLVWMNAT